jgi:hypothetical protein
MKFTLELADKDDGGVDLHFDFDPPLEQAAGGSPAAYMAREVLSTLEEIQKTWQEMAARKT